MNARTFFTRKNPHPDRRYCPDCKVVKHVSDFPRHRGTARGIGAYCRLCKAARNMEYRRRMEGLPVEAIAHRLWAGVQKTDSCWLWTGSIKKQDGYGVLWVGGKLKRVHRIAWELAGRELPHWPRVLDHICNVRRCVRLEHLQVLTQADNVAKANARRRAEKQAA